MEKKMILGLFLALVTVSFSQETVLVPVENGYKRVPISEVIPNDDLIERLEKELQNRDYQEKMTQPKKSKRVFMKEDDFSLEDLLDISLNYSDKNYDKNSLKDNKNYYQNRIVNIFVENSKVKRNINQDDYLFNIDILNSNNTFENDSNKELNTIGILAGVQYGINDNWNIKFNLGYIDSDIKLNNTKNSNDLFLGLDLNYNSLPYDEETEYTYGVRLGYLNSDLIDEYKVEDIFVGLLYFNMDIPVIGDSFYTNLGYETSIFSNKVELGLRQNLYINDNLNLNVKLTGDYVFGYKDRDNKFYTHLDEDKPTVTLEVPVKFKSLEIAPYYEFINKNGGISIKYHF